MEPIWNHCLPQNLFLPQKVPYFNALLHEANLKKLITEFISKRREISFHKDIYKLIKYYFSNFQVAPLIKNKVDATDPAE